MDGGKVGWGLVALVCVTAVVSGPLVSQVDGLGSTPTAPAPQTGGTLGEGAASVSVQELPAQVRFTPGRFKSGAYYLRTPPIRVTTQSISGQPILVCQFELPALNYSTVKLEFLDESTTGTHVFQFETGPFGSEELDAAPYRGELSIALRANGEKTVIASRNVTVVVES